MTSWLNFLHVSDLHFGHGDAHTRFDQEIVLQRLHEDAEGLAGQLGPPDFILCTGDVAFSATPNQYQSAAQWLRKLQHALSTRPPPLMIVPGNHDIDRERVRRSPQARAVHESLRTNPRALDEFFAQPEDLQSSLWPKLQAFATFTEAVDAPEISTRQPFWERTEDTSIGRVSFVGLNTALLSRDDNDSLRTLYLGKRQIQSAALDPPQDALAVVLLHHPPSWLGDGGDLMRQLQNRHHLLFSGHVHDQDCVFLHFAHGGEGLHFMAGAGHGDVGDVGRHGYAWVRLGAAGVEYYPRVYTPELGRFRPAADAFPSLDRRDECVRLGAERLPESLRLWLRADAPFQDAPFQDADDRPDESGSGSAQASEVRPFLHLPTPRDIPQDGGLYNLLSWRCELAPLIGRERERSVLLDWIRASEPGVRVFWLCGPGGVGKTRLAVETCRVVTNDGDFAAGFVDARQRPTVPERDTCMVFDYPEENRDAVLAWMATLANAPVESARIRVILLSRRGLDGQWEEALGRVHARHLCDGSYVRTLGPLRPEDCYSLFSGVCERLAAAYGWTDPDIDGQTLADWRARAPSTHGQPLFVTAAAVHASSFGERKVSLAGGGIMAALVDREIGRIDALGRELGLAERAGSRVCGLAALALEGLDASAVRRLADPELALGLPSVNQAVAQVARIPHWRERRLHAPTPDLLAAALVQRILDREPDTQLTAEWLWAVLEGQAKEQPAGQMAAHLGRLCDDIDTLTATSQRPGQQRLSGGLAQMLDGRPGRASAMEAVVRTQTLPVGLLEMAVAFWRIRVEQYRRQPDGRRDDAALVEALNDLAVHQHAIGHNNETLASGRQAVTEARRLAEAQPGRHTFTLVRTLNNLFAYLRESGHFAEAADIAQEAVDLTYPQMRENNPDFSSFAPEYVTSLHNRAVALRDGKRHEDAQAVMRHAVALNRILYDAIPEQHTKTLAARLHELALMLNRTQEHTDEALECVREAVDLRRRLVVDNPAHYAPELAYTLTTLAETLRYAQRYGDALEAIDDALELYRRFVHNYPERYQPDVAGARLEKARSLAYLERIEEAEQELRTSLELQRQLAERQPVLYLPMLASNLDVLSRLLYSTDRTDEARRASKEATDTLRGLTELDPEQYGEEYRAREFIETYRTHLRRIQLRDIRCFADVDLRLSSNGSLSGQWIAILGDNGAGKSTLLRALALALAAPEVAEGLTRLSEATMVRSSATSGSARVFLGGRQQPLAVKLTPGDNRDLLTSSNAVRPPVFAYGCRRGSALGGPRRESKPEPDRGLETLFSETANLIHAPTWLDKMEGIARRGGAREQFFYRQIIDKLVSLMPGVEGIEIDGDELIAHGAKVGRVPMRALSDGYLTTLGWVVDFIARLTEYARKRDIRARITDLPCVVLIDELDLHLHPRWQTEVIRLLREAFANVTFVVTTHNPMTLRHARPGEVFVIERDKAGQSTIVQRDLPPGIDAHGLLTGRWFGVASTLLDPEALRDLEEHRRLLLADEPDSKGRILALEEKLRRRLGGYADTSLERVAQSLVADYLDREDKERITDDDRAALQAEFERAMREREAGTPA